MFERSEKQSSRWGLAGVAILITMQWTSLWAATTISECGKTINQTGDYILVADLDCDSVSGIVIEGSGVVVRLNGHNITGHGAGGSGIEVRSASSVGILGPSTISGFPTGVSFLGVEHSRMSMVTFARNDFGFVIGKGRASRSNIFENNTATNNIAGFWITNGEVNTFHGNTATGNIFGFVTRIEAGGPCRGNIFEFNRATNNHVGFEIGGEGDSFRANTSMGNSSYGFIFRHGAHDNRVSNNTVYENEFYGIDAQNGATHNVIDFNTVVNNSSYDLYEEADICVNLWENNTFGRANESCIH